MDIHRVKENGFYILYKRHVPHNDVTPHYAIYRTLEFGGDMFCEYRTYQTALSVFNKATKQAIQYAEEERKLKCT